jgi:3-phosphoglycerate kinase
MAIKTIHDVSVTDKLVLVRNDFNVPLNDELEIIDDTRIIESLPTIRYLLAKGARVICCSHLGRPKGKKVAAMSLAPVSKRLEKLLGMPVQFSGDTIEESIKTAKTNLKSSQILLLENLRFYPEETQNDPEFAKKLAGRIDIYVNDAFGASHRAHASIDSITHFVPQVVSGLLVKKEIDYLSMAVEKSPKEFVVILGGAKVADKIPVISNLLEKAKTILIGGAMAYTFLKAQGYDVGGSRVEADSISICQEILEKAQSKNINIYLPIDHIAAIKIEPNITVRMIRDNESIPPEMMGLDIGFDTITKYVREISKAKLIFWNGPMGVFEIDTFASGTMEIAKAVANSSATSIIGGGDTVSAVNLAQVKDRITHISTGGGASLEYLSGAVLPGIAALERSE